MSTDDLGLYMERYEKAVATLRRTMWTELMDFKEYGVTAPQFSMLKLLENYGPSKITDLADRFDVKPSAISVMIDRLVASGFVERHQDEQDRRIVLVSISEAGMEMIRKAMDKARKIMSKYFALLDPEDMRHLVEVNEKLAEIALHMKKEK